MRPPLFALCALLLGAALAAAGTPEEDYIAARNAAVARLEKLVAKSPDADTSKANDKALADLDKRLQAIIGGLAAKPYPAKGKIAMDTLFADDVGFGQLDALQFAKSDEGPRVYVTTDGLLMKWLAQPQEWWTSKSKTPPTIDQALTTADFYNLAINEDAALSKTADLPISKPEGATFAIAMLGGWSQDIGPNQRQDLIVAVRKAGKVYIATENARKYKPIPACEAVWKDAEKKADAIFKKYQAAPKRDEKLFDSYTAEQAKGDAAYHACYVERAPKEAFYPELVKEAQEIADRFKGE